MILIPAIDIKNGKVVRLYKGKFSDVTYYEFTPIEAAAKWIEMGAQWLHLVDLDGAQTGEMKNIDVIKEIIQSFNVRVQVGGGIRSETAVESLWEAGVSRIVFGTKAIEDKSFIPRIFLKYGNKKMAVSLDCLFGNIASRGWTMVSNLEESVLDVIKNLEKKGVENFIYTDITKDGTLEGPNFEAILTVLNSVHKDTSLIASGGISSLEDVKKLNNLKSEDNRSLWGAITGKAIYEGKLDFKEALENLK